MSAHSSLDQALITTVGGSLCEADEPQCFSTFLASFLPNVAERQDSGKCPCMYPKMGSFRETKMLGLPLILSGLPCGYPI